MAGFTYNKGANGLLSNTISFTSDTIKARLYLATDTPDPDSIVMTGLGVIGSDVVLTGKSGPSIDDANDRNIYSCSNITFPGQVTGPTCDAIIVFKFGGSDATSIPIAFIEIDPVAPNEGDIVLTIPSSGLFCLNSSS